MCAFRATICVFRKRAADYLLRSSNPPSAWSQLKHCPHFSVRHSQALVCGQHVSTNQCRAPARASETYSIVPAIVGVKNIRSLRARIALPQKAIIATLLRTFQLTEPCKPTLEQITSADTVLSVHARSHQLTHQTEMTALHFSITHPR